MVTKMMAMAVHMGAFFMMLEPSKRVIPVRDAPLAGGQPHQVPHGGAIQLLWVEPGPIAGSIENAHVTSMAR